ncbi:MAG: cytochrome c-type biogenesis protein CcmH [Aestuariivita sp.]|nr:cytochrome c-type biogenesis protein CcmH [Aestuariivita sp.]MCY4346716.1 cytochrome c-type biogenesis protein CcmH [Aestuariivita sp.]
MSIVRGVRYWCGVWAVTLLVLGVAPNGSLAVQPDEILADPSLEQRARDISKNIRCLVCRNESIDESNADLARDLRLLVRERLVSGESDKEVIDFVVERYGEYVLLRPLVSGSNWLLYAAPPAIFFFSVVLGLLYFRSRRLADATQEQALDQRELAKLNELLDN